MNEKAIGEHLAFTHNAMQQANAILELCDAEIRRGDGASAQRLLAQARLTLLEGNYAVTRSVLAAGDYVPWVFAKALKTQVPTSRPLGDPARLMPGRTN